MVWNIKRHTLLCACLSPILSFIRALPSPPFISRYPSICFPLSFSFTHFFFVSFPFDLHILFFLSLCLSIYLYRLPSFSHTREGVRIQIKEPTWNSEQVLPVEHNTDANTREHFPAVFSYLVPPALTQKNSRLWSHRTSHYLTRAFIVPEIAI